MCMTNAAEHAAAEAERGSVAQQYVTALHNYITEKIKNNDRQSYLIIIIDSERCMCACVCVYITLLCVRNIVSKFNTSRGSAVHREIENNI